MAEPQGTDNPVSLNDILQVIRQQGASIAALDAKISGELDGIKQDVHGSASQVKKLKTESQYKWRFEGNKVQFLLNSELLEEIDQVKSCYDSAHICPIRAEISTHEHWENVFILLFV